MFRRVRARILGRGQSISRKIGPLIAMLVVIVVVVALMAALAGAF